MESSDLTRLTLSIHGIHVDFLTNNPSIESAVKRLFRHFVSEPTSEPFRITFSLLDRGGAVPDWCLPPAEALLYYCPAAEDRIAVADLGVDTLKLSGDPTGTLFFADFGGMGRIAYRLDRGEAHGHVFAPERIDAKVLSGTIVMLVMSHLLAAKGCFLAHCGAAEKRGKGILIPGFSGSGKTTASIALARKGFGFLSDDRSLIRAAPDGSLRLLSFPEDVDVTDETIALFPELGEGDLFKGQTNGPGKKSFDPEEAYPGCVTDSCAPGVILYPERHPHRKSRLEEMPKSEALSAFMPHSLLVLDRTTTESNFDAVFQLVQSSDCYRLKFGSEVVDLPDLVESII